jgi:lambda repressor-like predicted transcriptional regulator
MHHEDIKATIRKSGTSPAAIARALQVTPATVSNVIKGTTISRRIARHISLVTRKKFSDLWPGRYPDMEFVEAAGLSTVASSQAEADLSKLQHAAAKAPAKKPARKSQGARP